MPYVNNTVQRHKIADYLNVSTTGTASYALLGTGFTSLNESPNAQVKSTKYINNPSATKTTTSYETQFPFNSELIASEAVIMKIYNMATLQKTGGDCETEYIRVDLFTPKYTETADIALTEGKTYYTVADGIYTAVATPNVADIGNYYEASASDFHARKFPVSVEVSSIDENDGNIQISGNLNQAGLMVEGYFNISTKAFTANT